MELLLLAKTFHRLLLTGYLLLCLPALLCAQTGRHDLAGRVLDPGGMAVTGASVRAFGANQILLAETQTDERGQFTLQNLPPGRYELRIEARGFALARQAITLSSRPPAPIEISLSLTPVETRVTVTAKHGAPEETLYEAATVEVRTHQELLTREVGHLPRQLAEQPGVWTQETTPGQGSPILRGQGAQTVLYLVDGVRFNNSTYRSGHTQYLGWIPSSATDAVEVFLGPAGTQYGSDSLGGAINILSSSLPPWSGGDWTWGGKSQTFFQSANLQGGTAIEIFLAGPKLSFLLGGNFTRAQNLRTGGGRDSRNSLTRFLGLSSSDVRRILGVRLQDTAYTQGSWHSKLGLWFGKSQFLTASWMQSEQWGVRRYDRLLGGEGRLRSLFLPQRLRFGYLRYQTISPGLLQRLTATVSFNQQIDGRVQQTRDTSNLRNELNRVTSIGYTLATEWKPAPKHSLGAGIEIFDEFIAARRLETPPGGATEEVRPRFPNGSRYLSLGVYLTDDWKPNNRWIVDGGARFSHFRFRSRSSKNVFVNGAATVPDTKESFSDLTFHSGVTFAPNETFVLVGRVARGFRAPTVFDLGQLGLTGGGFEVAPGEILAFDSFVGDSAGNAAASTGDPWRPLEPEVLWSFEGGLRWRAEKLRGSITVFDSESFDAIQRRTILIFSPVVGQTIGGQTITVQDAEGRIFVDLDSRPVVSRANIGRVRIYGLEAATSVTWTPQWSSSFKAGLQRGKELDTGNFARRIAPANFFGGARWNSRGGRLWLEVFTKIAAAQTRLNPSELNDPRVGAFRAPDSIENFFENGATRLGLVENGLLQPTGETVDEVIARVLGNQLAGASLFDRTEGFATLNLRGNLRLTEISDLFFSLTNLTDENYRLHGSGFDAPGLNLSLSYLVRFR